MTDSQEMMVEEGQADVLEIAQVALEQERYEIALELAEDYLEEAPLDTDAMNLCAVAAAHLDDSVKAEALYSKALLLDPGNGSVHHNYGVLLERQGRYPEAVSHFRRSLELQPDFPEAYINLGNALDELGKPEEALDLYLEAVRRLPDNADAFYNLGYVLNRLGRFAEAVENFDRVLGLQDSDAAAWNGKGYALAGLKEYDKALIAYSQALDLEPENGNYWYNQGLTYSAMQNRPEALTCYSRAVECDSELVEAWLERINLLVELKYHVEAAEALVKVSSLVPESPEPPFYKGMLFSHQGRFEDALTMMDQALEKDDHCLHALNNKGNILLSLGRLEEAEACFQSLLGMNANYALAHYNLACVHAQREDLTSALESLQTAISLDENCRKDAAEDPDFSPVAREPEFLALVKTPVRDN